jgi:predicted nucleic acid-binding protein
MGQHGRRILDTNVLINHLRLLPADKRKPDGARKWALQLIAAHNTKLIGSPVRIEFLAGALSGDQLKLYLAYIEEFEVVDENRIPHQDWEEAERIAKRIKPKGRRRKLGDCLLQAIALRLNCDIVTADSDFRQRVLP